MSSPGNTVPPVWNEVELETDRRQAVANFVSERMAEGSARYQAVFSENLVPVRSLLEATNDLLDFASGTALALNPGLTRAARYLSGPPVSADDLDTLADTSIASRRRLDADLARRAADVIQVAMDPERFPWLFVTPRRSPTLAERDAAIRWTAGLMTVQQIQTRRRGESSGRQERAVVSRLQAEGFREVSPRPIETIDDLAPGQFCRESLVAGSKCDVPVRLRDGRYLFVECKVSNSSTNSVKRLIREVGGKERSWRVRFDGHNLTAAVLAGVFKLKNLNDAQAEYGIAVFWEHDLEKLAAFLRAAK